MSTIASYLIFHDLKLILFCLQDFSLLDKDKLTGRNNVAADLSLIAAPRVQKTKCEWCSATASSIRLSKLSMPTLMSFFPATSPA